MMLILHYFEGYKPALFHSKSMWNQWTSFSPTACIHGGSALKIFFFPWMQIWSFSQIEAQISTPQYTVVQESKLIFAQSDRAPVLFLVILQMQVLEVKLSS